VGLMGDSGGLREVRVVVRDGGVAKRRAGSVVDGNDPWCHERRRTNRFAGTKSDLFSSDSTAAGVVAKGNIAIAQYIHGDRIDPHRFEV